MDFHGYNVHHIGYGHPRLIEAITQQTREPCFAPRRYTCALAVELAEKVAAITPGDLGQVLFAPGSSDAIETPLAYARACDDFGALLVFDEIPTGLGKTGRMFACEHEDVVPDILVLGKSLGGGILPIAAVVARPELDVSPDFAYGHYTHEKNPVTARAALTTMAIIENEGLVQNAAAVGKLALERLEEMKESYPLIGDVRGRGCLLGIELVLDRESEEPA